MSKTSNNPAGQDGEREKKPLNFKRRQPCGNCPYRTDAPLRHWAPEEFVDLVSREQQELGCLQGCHKNDGGVCGGWLMKQDEAGLPSIMLRLALSKHRVTAAYLDSLQCPAPLFADLLTMCQANYPEIFKPAT